jgi:TonB family protein
VAGIAKPSETGDMSSKVSESSPEQLTLGLLPESRTRWGRFVLSYGAQTIVMGFFVVAALVYPEVLVLPIHDYHFVSLVETPAPVPQKPAPLRNFPVPPPKISEPVAPRPEALRVPQEIVQPKKVVTPEAQPPKVTLAAKTEVLPDSKPIIPKQLVKTNVFSAGSSATPTMAAAPQKVQTGGFGDPNGVPAADNHGKPVTIMASGAFDMPTGPGYGNGTGGARGARGVVASAGFGNGVATGDGSGRVSASRGTVRQAGFGDADVVAKAQPKTTSAEPAVKTIPAEITFKPRPVYTEEGRRLKVEGEVLVEVVFSANGQIHVVRVVQGLGHGLDESAVRAAEQIQFKPALKNGQPTDFPAVLHIVFQLAS